MFEKFVDHNFRNSSLKIINIANDIIDEYQADGLVLTLRQLYYQFVARDIIPNSERSYKSLGNTISNAREAGLISWNAIEDRGRGARVVRGEETVYDVLADLESNIIIDPWENQDFYPEVWIEKEALIGTISKVCGKYRAVNMACKGYLSASEAWRAGHRFRRAVHEGKKPVIIHLGDHDPSGIDMTRDNRDRSTMFSTYDVEVRRIALNMDQIDEYSPPPNPAKLTDTRADYYIDRFGTQSWELDALSPRVLSSLVESELNNCISDQDAWNEVKSREFDEKAKLIKLRECWDDVSDYLDGIEEY